MLAARRRAHAPYPVMMAELGLASWETILHRTTLMASGACTIEEYFRMVGEKMIAMVLSGHALCTPSLDPWSAAVAPFHSRATANARRLRPVKPGQSNLPQPARSAA
jgi:hypothetical protein